MLTYLIISVAERASRSVTFVSLRDTQFTVVLGSVSSEQIESLIRDRYALMFDLRSRRDEALTARPWYTWLRSLAGNGDDIAPAAIGFTASTIATWQWLNEDGRVIVLADADAGECVERFLAAVRWGGEHLFQPTKEKEEDI